DPCQGKSFHLLQNLGRPGRNRPHAVGADRPVVTGNRIGVEDGYPLLFFEDSRKDGVPVCRTPSSSGTVERASPHEVANLLVGAQGESLSHFFIELSPLDYERIWGNKRNVKSRDSGDASGEMTARTIDTARSRMHRPIIDFHRRHQNRMVRTSG